MKKNSSNLKIKEINKKITDNELNTIIDLIKNENDYSILSKLSISLIKEYLRIAVNSKNIFLFILKKKNKIIGYSLFAKNADYLIKEFNHIKSKIFMDLLFRFNFFSILNILFAITKFDLIMISREAIDQNKKSLNLNLLAIDQKYQSQGLGNFFLQKTIKTIYKRIFQFNSTTCEAPTLRALNFYLKKSNFKLIGKKIRIGQNLFVLKKKYK